VLVCTPEQCTCRACGQPTTVIGYDRSEQLDVEPARYFVLVTKREKRVCQFCQEGGIATAPLATRIIDKALASDRVVIDTVVAKKANAILADLLRNAQSEYISPYSIGVVQAALGEIDKAFQNLERALTERDSQITYLSLDPELDALRSDSRFQSLLKRLHIPR